MKTFLLALVFVLAACNTDKRVVSPLGSPLAAPQSAPVMSSVVAPDSPLQLFLPVVVGE